MDLFDLAAKITLDSSEYERGLDKASKKLDEFGSKLKSGFATAAKISAAAITTVTAAATAMGVALLRGVSQIAAYGDNIDKMSQKMGLSTEAYQEWDFILQHSGASVDAMQRGMMTLTQAAESGSNAFQALGLSQEQVANMSQDELFAAAIKGLQGIDDAGQRAALAQKLFGASAKELGPLLNTSSEETEEMRKRVHELGGVMSEEAVKAAAAYQDSLQDMGVAFTGLKNRMLVEFMPAVTTVMDGLTELFAGNSEKGIELITEGVQSFAKTIDEVLPQLLDVFSQIAGPVIDALADQLPSMITTLIPILISAAGKIVIALVQALPEIMSALWEGIKVVAQELWPVLQEAFGAVGAWFGAKFSEAWSAIKSAFSNVGAFFSNLWDQIKDKFSALGTTIGNAISGAVSAGINAVIGFAESAINAGIDLINKAIKLINKIPGVSVGLIDPVDFPRLAIGKDYVPYDNYPAYLHKGEAVLTAREAEEWRRGGSESGKVVNLNIYAQQLSKSDMDYIVATVNRELA